MTYTVYRRLSASVVQGGSVPLVYRYSFSTTVGAHVHTNSRDSSETRRARASKLLGQQAQHRNTRTARREARRMRGSAKEPSKSPALKGDESAMSQPTLHGR